MNLRQFFLSSSVSSAFSLCVLCVKSFFSSYCSPLATGFHAASQPARLALYGVQRIASRFYR
jgi:hypothetical protein